MSQPSTNSRIESEYRARTPRSAELYAKARQVIPAGLTHDSRTLQPYPIYAAKAAGSRKWDVDGNDYVDYFGGHGALLLGHGHQSGRGGRRAASSGSARTGVPATSWRCAGRSWWGGLIGCAQRVRFTASGTEASHLALRLARAFTGKSRVIRFVGHFHGWHDGVAAGAMSHFSGGVPAGIPPALVEQTLLLPADDLARVSAALEAARISPPSCSSRRGPPGVRCHCRRAFSLGCARSPAGTKWC